VALIGLDDPSLLFVRGKKIKKNESNVLRLRFELNHIEVRMKSKPKWQLNPPDIVYPGTMPKHEVCFNVDLMC